MLDSKPLLGCIAIPKHIRVKTQNELDDFIFKRWITLNHSIRSQMPDDIQFKLEASRATMAFLKIAVNELYF